MTLPETTSSRWTATEGLPFPLGLTQIEEEGAYNFAPYAKQAQSVTLLLYAESDGVNTVLEYRFGYLENKTGRIWHCRIPFVSMQGACYYAYRVARTAPNRAARPRTRRLRSKRSTSARLNSAAAQGRYTAAMETK